MLRSPAVSSFPAPSLHSQARADSIARTLELVQHMGLLQPGEVAQVAALFERGAPLSAAIRAAETVHVHIKVDDVAQLAHDAIRAGGGALENAKDGYMKYAFSSGMNVIFSSIDISEDDLRERQGAARKARPRLDHIGLDLRSEAADVRAVFDDVPRIAATLGWGHVAQGAEGRPVYCCHTNVLAKHWVYPPAAVCLEFAFGPLAIDPGKSGCDLRPSDPGLGLKAVTCCGTGDPGHLAAPGMGSEASYYQAADLARFAEIGQNRKDLAEKFFGWYGAVFADGALSAREKSIVALAVAHAVQCPYCIDAYTTDALGKGANLDQLTEAVHVAAAIRGGATLVHGVQMRSHARGHAAEHAPVPQTGKSLPTAK